MREKKTNEPKSVFEKPIWTYYEDRKKLIDILQEIDVVENVLQEMWFSCNIISDILKDRPLNSSTELFINTYYMRNITYLYSAYECARIGNTMPSYNLQRTILETIIKGYVFIVDEDIADKCYVTMEAHSKQKDEYRDILINIILQKQKLEPVFIQSSKKILNNKIIDSDKKGLIRKINQYSKFKDNLDILYKNKVKDYWDKIYGRICKPAHPSVEGTMSDLLLNINKTKECLEVILILCYMNMFMFLEVYYNDATPVLKTIFKDQFKVINETLKEVPLFIPNIQTQNNKLNLKNQDYTMI